MFIRPARALFALFCLAALALAASTAAAHASGTGDSPKRTSDVLSDAQAATKARLEADTRAASAGPDTAGRDAPRRIIEAPYAYLYTPSHEQQTGYWCGPATCQVIDHHLGSYATQRTYANYMGTTGAGTDFTLVDDCLRAYTGRPYYYYGGLSESGFTSRVSDTLMNHRMPLATDLNILASVWPNYNFDHAGHIVPIEAFDWRYNTIRLNDVFDESAYYPGGGPTLGHRTYDRAIVWNGVYNHFRRAVVSAP